MADVRCHDCDVALDGEGIAYEIEGSGPITLCATCHARQVEVDLNRVDVWCQACGVGTDVWAQTSSFTCGKCRASSLVTKALEPPKLPPAMKVVYCAHPFGGKPHNLARARRWLRWLWRTFPNVSFVAGWILECEQLDDGDPAVREQAIARDRAQVQRCDAILLVGGEVSAGMAAEREKARRTFDWTALGPEPPTSGWDAPDFDAWLRGDDAAL